MLSIFQSSFSRLMHGGIVWLFASYSAVLYAETAVEAIVRESKNPLLQQRPAAPVLTKFERGNIDKKSKQMLSAEVVAKLQAEPRSPYKQQIDEIIVEAQREPEDFKRAEPSPLQKMRASLDRVGPNLASAVMEYTSTDGHVMVCTREGNYCDKSRRIDGGMRAGELRTDGKLASGTFR